MTEQELLELLEKEWEKLFQLIDQLPDKEDQSPSSCDEEDQSPSSYGELRIFAMFIFITILASFIISHVSIWFKN